MKPIPKSLHTVTVFVEMALMAIDWHGNTAMSAKAAVIYVADKLGYSSTPDTYELMAQAVRKLNKMGYN